MHRILDMADYFSNCSVADDRGCFSLTHWFEVNPLNLGLRNLDSRNYTDETSFYCTCTVWSALRCLEQFCRDSRVTDWQTTGRTDFSNTFLAVDNISKVIHNKHHLLYKYLPPPSPATSSASVVKSRWLCYFLESRSTCQKFYFLESRSSLKIFYFLESRK